MSTADVGSWHDIGIWQVCFLVDSGSWHGTQEHTHTVHLSLGQPQNNTHLVSNRRESIKLKSSLRELQSIFVKPSFPSTKFILNVFTVNSPKQTSWQILAMLCRVHLPSWVTYTVANSNCRITKLLIRAVVVPHQCAPGQMTWGPIFETS